MDLTAAVNTGRNGRENRTRDSFVHRVNVRIVEAQVISSGADKRTTPTPATRTRVDERTRERMTVARSRIRK
jgi:hypothetical protein